MEKTPALGSKKKGRKKWIIIAGAVVVVVALVAIVPRFMGPMAGMKGDGAYANATVEKGTISTTVESSGNIEDNEMEIEIPYGVTVSDILVDEGDYVNDGDKIVTINSSSIDSKIDDVEDEIDDINDKIDDQKGNDENVNALKERKSELKSIKKSLEKIAKKDAIYSSGNGVINTIGISEGSKLTKDDSDDSSSTTAEDTTAVTEGENESSSMSLTDLRDEYFGTAVTVDSNDTVSMEVEIDELDISTVKKGQEATVALDAIEGEEFTGTVTKINSDIQISNGVVKYSAKIELEKSSDMKTGMSASATITKETKEDVLKIPVDAVQENSNGLFVYTTQEDDRLGGRTEITTGLSDGEMVEVLTGLSEGDTVYYTKASSGDDMDDMMMQGGFGGGGGRGQGGGEMPEGGSPPSQE